MRINTPFAVRGQAFGCDLSSDADIIRLDSGDVALCPHFQYGLKLKMGTQGDVPIFPGTAFLCVFVFPCHTSVPQHFPLLQQMLHACQGLRLAAKGFERLTLQIQEILFRRS